eukprot:1301383-Prymnesium_polylepis.1
MMRQRQPKAAAQTLKTVDWSDLDKRGYVWITSFLPNASTAEEIVGDWKRSLLLRHSRDRSTYLHHSDSPRMLEIKERLAEVVRSIASSSRTRSKPDAATLLCQNYSRVFYQGVSPTASLPDFMGGLSLHQD